MLSWISSHLTKSLIACQQCQKLYKGGKNSGYFTLVLPLKLLDELWRVHMVHLSNIILDGEQLGNWLLIMTTDYSIRIKLEDIT